MTGDNFFRHLRKANSKAHSRELFSILAHYKVSEARTILFILVEWIWRCSPRILPGFDNRSQVDSNLMTWHVCLQMGAATDTSAATLYRSIILKSADDSSKITNDSSV
jgi:hypothetical protein